MKWSTLIQLSLLVVILLVLAPAKSSSTKKGGCHCPSKSSGGTCPKKDTPPAGSLPDKSTPGKKEEEPNPPSKCPIHAYMTWTNLFLACSIVVAIIFAILLIKQFRSPKL